MKREPLFIALVMLTLGLLAFIVYGQDYSLNVREEVISGEASLPDDLQPFYTMTMKDDKKSGTPSFNVYKKGDRMLLNRYDQEKHFLNQMMKQLKLDAYSFKDRNFQIDMGMPLVFSLGDDVVSLQYDAPEMILSVYQTETKSKQEVRYQFKELSSNSVINNYKFVNAGDSLYIGVSLMDFNGENVLVYGLEYNKKTETIDEIPALTQLFTASKDDDWSLSYQITSKDPDVFYLQKYDEPSLKTINPLTMEEKLIDLKDIMPKDELLELYVEDSRIYLMYYDEEEMGHIYVHDTATNKSDLLIETHDHLALIDGYIVQTKSEKGKIHESVMRLKDRSIVYEGMVSLPEDSPYILY